MMDDKDGIQAKSVGKGMLKTEDFVSKVSKKRLNSLAWLDHFIETPFYQERGGYCDNHPKPRYATHYCYICMGSPVCEDCWEKSTMHKDHTSSHIRVFRCSRRTAVAVEHMKELCDVSEIKDTTINKRKVFYLKSDKEPSKGNCNENRSACGTCNQRLGNSKFKFCSIACNKTMIEHEEELLRPSKRTKRRKGTPCRSFTSLGGAGGALAPSIPQNRLPSCLGESGEEKECTELTNTTHQAV